MKGQGKVLITVPCLDLPGGVVEYYKILRPCLARTREYFEVGNKQGEKNFFKALSRFLGDYIKFYKKLAKGDYSLVHINPSLGYKSFIRDGLFVLIAKLHKKPVFVFFHGWNVDCERTIRNHFLRFFRLIYGRADGFIVLANEFKKKLEEMGCRAPVFVETTVIPDSIFLNNYSTTKKNTEAKAPLTILFLSRLEKEKGIYETIESYALLKKKFPHIRLKIAGNGSEYEKAQALVKEQQIDDVEFSGFVKGENKRLAFSESDIYIFPTTHGEGMPISVLEAMAYGLPVITRPVGGLCDFFENGRMGYITESLNPADFADLLEKLIIDKTLRSKMGEYNRHYARNRFAASKVAARLEKIYEQISASS